MDPRLHGNDRTGDPRRSLPSRRWPQGWRSWSKDLLAMGIIL